MLRDKLEFFEASEALLAKNVRPFIINTTVVKAILLRSLKRPVWRRIREISEEWLLLLFICTLREILEDFGGKRLRGVKVGA